MPAGDGTGSYRDPGPPPPPDPIHIANLHRTVAIACWAREMLGDMYDPYITVHLDTSRRVVVHVDYGIPGRRAAVCYQLAEHDIYEPAAVASRILQHVS